ncbi:MAG: hypothetical protein Q7J16_05790 [Candidatus Cloacimonadales bacterium]|nr:hypothetical protein [Candidatus Cloacimonadales bacterium]
MKKIILITLLILSFAVASAYDIFVHVVSLVEGSPSGVVLAKWIGCATQGPVNFHGDDVYQFTSYSGGGSAWAKATDHSCWAERTVTGVGSTAHIYLTIPREMAIPEPDPEPNDD